MERTKHVACHLLAGSYLLLLFAACRLDLARPDTDLMLQVNEARVDSLRLEDSSDVRTQLDNCCTTAELVLRFVSRQHEEMHPFIQSPASDAREKISSH